MGLAGQLDHPDVQEAKQRVLNASKDRKLASGIHIVNSETAEVELKRVILQGYQFIALGTGILFLGKSCRQLAFQARQAINL